MPRPLPVDFLELSWDLYIKIYKIVIKSCSNTPMHLQCLDCWKSGKLKHNFNFFTAYLKQNQQYLYFLLFLYWWATFS